MDCGNSLSSVYQDFTSHFSESKFCYKPAVLYWSQVWTCCCHWLSAACTIRLVRFSILCYWLYWIDKSDRCSVSVRAAATDNHAVTSPPGEIALSQHFILSVQFCLESENFMPALLFWWALGVNNRYANPRSSCLWQVPSVCASRMSLSSRTTFTTDTIWAEALKMPSDMKLPKLSRNLSPFLLTICFAGIKNVTSNSVFVYLQQFNTTVHKLFKLA